MSNDTPNPSFHPLLDESALANNSMEIVEAQGRKILLAKRYGRIYALDNTCPHLGGSLGRGTLQGDRVVCPLHHWVFELATGRAVEGVADEKVAVYETKVEDGKIWVRVS